MSHAGRRGGALALAVALALFAARAEAQDAPLPGRAEVADRIARIAMLEDTRCPEGTRVSAYLAAAQARPVRLRAARALARLQDSTTVEALARTLSADEFDEIRREAAFALGQIGHRSAFEALAAASERDADAGTRALALEALGKVGDRRATAIAARALGASESEIRREAAIALWRLGDSTAVEPLVAALGDANDEVRAYATWALEKTVAPARVSPAVAALSRDRSWLVRAYAARTLGRQGSSVRLDTLIALAEDGDVRVRVSAVRAIGQIADSTAVPALLARLDDPHPHVRELAATALGALRDPAVAPRLAALQRDQEPAVRAATAGPLAALLPDVEAWAAIEPLLRDDHERVRAAALDALGVVETKEAEQRLLAALAKPREPSGSGRSGVVPTPLERAVAAGALAKRESGAAREPLLRLLAEKDADPAVVASAAEALGDIGGGPPVADALVRAIRTHKNPNEPDVEVAALEALAKLKSAAGETAAREAMRSPQRPVREAGRGLFVALHGEAEGTKRAAAAPGPPAWREAPVDSYRTVAPLARRAMIYTARGEIEVVLFPDDAPRTVANFVRLAERGYFDRGAFHRVVPNFVVQDGDPTGTGWGGPGYAIRCEYNRRRYGAGALGMALAGKDTGGSQWFITHSPQPHLDGRYTIFGQVAEGWEFLADITLGDRIERVRIER